jgi:hypothetical protein
MPLVWPLVRRALSLACPWFDVPRQQQLTRCAEACACAPAAVGWLPCLVLAREARHAACIPRCMPVLCALSTPHVRLSPTHDSVVVVMRLAAAPALFESSSRAALVACSATVAVDRPVSTNAVASPGTSWRALLSKAAWPCLRHFACAFACPSHLQQSTSWYATHREKVTQVTMPYRPQQRLFCVRAVGHCQLACSTQPGSSCGCHCVRGGKYNCPDGVFLQVLNEADLRPVADIKDSALVRAC